MMATKFAEQITRAFEVVKAQEQRHKERQDDIKEDKVKEKLDFMGVTEALIVGNKVKVGGVTFRATFYDGKIDGWQVQGDCQECGRRCWSPSRRNLAGIGEMYLEFKPDYVHRCSSSSRQTTEERFLAALSDLIEKIGAGE